MIHAHHQAPMRKAAVWLALLTLGLVLAWALSGSGALPPGARCQNASDALVRAAPDAVDVVVTDFNMPTCSGLELAEALAQVRADLPVVISSGYISEELRTGAERLGVLHLLQKQDTVEELAGLLRRVLSR